MGIDNLFENENRHCRELALQVIALKRQNEDLLNEIENLKEIIIQKNATLDAVRQVIKGA